MHVAIRSFASALLAAIAVSAAPAATAAEPFYVAVTVDDLPAHGVLTPGTTRLGVARSYLKTLKADGVPEAFGFVNGKKVDEDPATEAVLTAWRKAGYPLGNHAYSHMNLTRAPSLEAWKGDVAAGEAAVERHMRGADWRYFRFPNLATGSGERRDAAAAYLRQRAYRTAHVTLSFSDWSYGEPYARCLAKGDAAAIAALKAHYLQEVDDGIAGMKAVSHRTYGRMIPQVLLTHVGDWAALMLPDVMARLKAAGALFVPLGQAQSDPAYAEADRHLDGGNIMERAARRKGVDVAGLRGPRPQMNPEALCR